MKRNLSVLLIVVICIAHVGCVNPSATSTPEKTIESLEMAINERDFDKILDCFTPQYKAEIKAQFEFANLIAGFSGLGNIFSEDIIDGIFGITLGDNYVDLEVLDIRYNDDMSSASMLVLLSMGEDSSIDIVEVVRISNNWYLSVDIE